MQAAASIPPPAPLLRRPPPAHMTPHPLSTRTAVHAGAGNLPAAYTLLVRNGVLAQLVAILRGAPDNLLTQPARLFAAIVSLSAEGATLATHPSPSLDAAKKAGKGAGPPAEAGACSLLPLVMGRATDGVASAAAAAATGHLVKKDAKARCGGGWGALHGLMGGAHWECALCCRGPSTSTRRKGVPGLTHTHTYTHAPQTQQTTRACTRRDELVQVEGVVALVRVVQETAPSNPFFADACAALAAVACLIESSRVEVARSVRAMLLRPVVRKERGEGGGLGLGHECAGKRWTSAHLACMAHSRHPRTGLHSIPHPSNPNEKAYVDEKLPCSGFS